MLFAYLLVFLIPVSLWWQILLTRERIVEHFRNHS